MNKVLLFFLLISVLIFEAAGNAATKQGSFSFANENTTNAITPNKGVVNNIVISIRFADQPKTELNVQVYDSIFNDMNTLSFKRYFMETSNGQLSINSTYFPKTTTNEILEYQDDKPRNYYCWYDEATNPDGYPSDDWQTREKELLQKALNFVEDELEASGLDFDANNDGVIDNVNFFIQGSDINSHIIYPHANRYSTCTVLGKKAIYNVNNTGYFINVVGTICHEFYHSLGAPDLYQYNSYFLMPVGSFDIMATGGGTSLAYMKLKYGKWFDEIPEITEPGTYSLQPLSKNPFACYKIKSPNSTTEYFVLEYRKREGLIDSLRYPRGYDEGLIIYRINTLYEGNKAGPKDEVYMYRPDGMPQENGKLHQAAFSANSGRTTFSDTSNPSCFLSNGDLGGIKITEIGDLGETISFKVEELSKLPAPKNLALTKDKDIIQLNWDSPTSQNTKGYNVYKVGSSSKLNSQLITETTFNDTLDFTGDLFYRVTAVYDEGESEPVTASINVNFAPYVLPSDSLALVDLYNDCNGANWINNTNWLNAPVKDWYGVSLVEDRVQRIILRSNNLTGEFPSSLTHLTKLETLGLESNKISGNIPTTISSIQGLYNLYLSNNELSGEIPEELYEIQNINQIFLDENQLEGTISDKIGNLQGLSYLNLDKNKLTGSIPSSLYDIKRIERIHLANNNFSGSISNDVSLLIQLDEFVINGNLFTDLPDMSSLKNLYMFDISNNNFTFEDLEANLNIKITPTTNGFSKFSYSPQKEVGTEQTISIDESSDYQLNIEVGGAQNEYMWYKDGVSLGQKLTIPEFELNNVTTTDAGVYYCEITNTLVPDLTLHSKNISITVNQTTDIDKLGEFGITIFPNPSNGKFTIQHQQEIVEIKIYTIEGRMIFCDKNLSSNRDVINLNYKGICIIQLTTNSGDILNEKIVLK